MVRKGILLLLVVTMAFGLAGCTDLTSGRISATRTGSINGVVEDANGNSLHGVEITVGNKTATTGSSGIFQITDIQVGSYHLVARYNGKEVKADIVVGEGSNRVETIVFGGSEGSEDENPPAPTPKESIIIDGKEFSAIPYSFETSGPEEEWQVVAVGRRVEGDEVLIGVKYSTTWETGHISFFNPPNGNLFMYIKRNVSYLSGENTVVFEIEKSKLQNPDLMWIVMKFMYLPDPDEHASLIGLHISDVAGD